MPYQAHVSAKVTAAILAAADAMDWPWPVTLEAAGADPARLRDTAGWVSWDEYLAMLKGLAGNVDDPERWVQTGILAMEHSGRGSFRHVGHLVGGVRPLYEATFGWVMKSMMRGVEMEITELGPARLRITVRVDPAQADSQAYLYNIGGTMIALPGTLGHAHADVQMVVDSHVGTYEVTLPPSTSLVARARRAWAAFSDQEGFELAVSRLRESITTLVGDLHEANARLASSEARWRRLAESLPGLVFVIGADGVEGPYGAHPPTDGLIDAILESFDRSGARQAVFESGEEARFEVVGGDGSTSWAWTCHASRLESEPRAVLVAVDETERQRAQHALRRSEERYLQAQKMEALGRLAGGVAHDFNNLLAAVQGHTELLELTHGDDPAVARHAEGILNAVQDATALTRQLLAYGRNRPVHVTTVDAAEVIRSHESMYRRLVGDPIAVHTEIESDGLGVFADASQLQQVLMNLVVNARDAMPDGGELWIRAGRVVRDAEAWIDLEVCDEGTGMTPETLLRAMEPFFTTKRVGRGTGLGLSTVYWIAEQAGGQVEIESTIGKGTCVHVYLPEVTTSGPAPRHAAPREAPAPGQETVLLVEDEPRVREMVTDMLKSQGYSVIACAHAAEARRLLDEGAVPPDLVLSDVTMPGESGLSLAQDLARRFPTMGLVLMSGYTAEAPIADTRITFVAKPFSLTTLANAVRDALDATRP